MNGLFVPWGSRLLNSKCGGIIWLPPNVEPKSGGLLNLAIVTVTRIFDLSLQTFNCFLEIYVFHIYTTECIPYVY